MDICSPHSSCILHKTCSSKTNTAIKIITHTKILTKVFLNTNKTMVVFINRTLRTKATPKMRTMVINSGNNQHRTRNKNLNKFTLTQRPNLRTWMMRSKRRLIISFTPKMFYGLPMKFMRKSTTIKNSNKVSAKSVSSWCRGNSKGFTRTWVLSRNRKSVSAI